MEQNAQRLSGQLDELAAVANTAKGGARAAQETADSAVAGVNVTNERISALDDYEPQTVAAVNFRVGSSVLSPDSKTKLDDVATKALNSKGYVLEVSGFTDTTGSLREIVRSANVEPNCNSLPGREPPHSAATHHDAVRLR